MTAQQVIKEIEEILIKNKMIYMSMIAVEDSGGIATAIMTRGMSNTKALGIIELKKHQFIQATLNEIDKERNGESPTYSTPLNIN